MSKSMQSTLWSSSLETHSSSHLAYGSIRPTKAHSDRIAPGVEKGEETFLLALGPVLSQIQRGLSYNR